ncbi:aspartate/glutamate racemase family protein [Variovorax humicola]|uniref:Aspartate/glutamate racemase family protein n=1 Tax=Variovorax humicola TaxID=1769758 RepID=A0ABU8VZ91_9BURK
MEKLARRIALIHATPVAMSPIADAFGRLWPEALLMNVLDDSLSADLSRAGGLDAALTQRFVDLAQYAERAGAHGILFTCSAFGAAIEAAANAVQVPTLKPNEAMFLEALTSGNGRAATRIGLVSTFAPSVPSMAEELMGLAKARSLNVELSTECADGALKALSAGDAASHDRLVVEHAARLAQCDVVMLGQFSMARAQQLVIARTEKTVLTSPDSAVRLLKKALVDA